MSILLEVNELKKYFKVPIGYLHAVDGVSFSLEAEKTLGVVGESGCGKSTLARLLLGHQKPTQGIVLFKDQPIPEPRSKPWRAQRAAMQMIYQDPYGCFDARMPVIEQVAEPLMVHKHLSKESALERAF